MHSFNHLNVTSSSDYAVFLSCLAIVTFFQQMSKKRVQMIYPFGFILAGLFMGDAVAMPVHWYYNVPAIKDDYNGWISKYEKPKDDHPTSILRHSNTGTNVYLTAMGKCHRTS